MLCGSILVGIFLSIKNSGPIEVNEQKDRIIPYLMNVFKFYLILQNLLLYIKNFF